MSRLSAPPSRLAARPARLSVRSTARTRTPRPTAIQLAALLTINYLKDAR